MKKLSLMATVVAFLIALGIARADKDDDKSGTDIRVETKVYGDSDHDWPGRKGQGREVRR